MLKYIVVCDDSGRVIIARLATNNLYYEYTIVGDINVAKTIVKALNDKVIREASVKFLIDNNEDGSSLMDVGQ